MCGVAAILVSLIVGLGLIRVLPELAGDAHDLIVNVVRVVMMTGLALIMIPFKGLTLLVILHVSCVSRSSEHQVLVSVV